MWNAGRGFMAIWSEVSSEDSAFYHDWLLKEHLPERVGIPGFIAARVFRRTIGEGLQFFILYETETPEILASPAYLARLNSPTRMSQAVMPKLKNFVRGAGRVLQSSGVCGGGVARVMRFEEPATFLGDPKARDDLFSKIVAINRVLAIRLFEVDTAATTIQTEEKKMRTSREAIFNQLLVIEAADLDALDAVSAFISQTLSGSGNLGQTFDQSYQFITELQGRSLN